MAGTDWRNKFAIVGLGITRQGRVPGYSSRAFQAEATRLALEDAGLSPKDVDGCIYCLPQNGDDFSDGVPRVLGLPCKIYWGMRTGGTTGAAMLLAAMGALESGNCTYVACVYGTNDWSWIHSGGARRRVERLGNWGHEFGAVAAIQLHAFFASRHMYEYGTTSRQLGAVAVTQRAHACRNPQAIMYGRPITIEDHQNSRFIVDPYRLLDCCLVTDGGVAFIVTTAERARSLRKPPVYISGMGFGHQVRELWDKKQNYTQLDVAPARDTAFRMAGIELRDVDCAQLYDCFTMEVIMQLEDYGWCPKGEGGAFAEAGEITFGRTIPVNTGGGLLASWYCQDFTPLAEGIIQVRGEGGERQVPKAQVCLVSGHGGEIIHPMCSSHSTTIFTKG